MFKYIVIVDGHSAPNRVLTLLLTARLVLRVHSGPSVAGHRLWCDAYLRPMEHYVPVRADLSDFEEKVRWLATHAKEAASIAANGYTMASALASRVGLVGGMRNAIEQAAPTKKL